MTSRGHRQVRAADTSNEERVAQAQPPVLGFGKWEELARKQKQLSKQQLSAMAQSKAIAVLDRNSYADGTWRRVFVVPKSRNFPGMAEVYDEHSQPLDEPNNGVAHGLQAQQAMMEEFGTEEYYRWPEVALASAEKKKPARLLPQLSPPPRPPGLPRTGAVPSALSLLDASYGIDSEDESGDEGEETELGAGAPHAVVNEELETGLDPNAEATRYAELRLRRDEPEQDDGKSPVDEPTEEIPLDESVDKADDEPGEENDDMTVDKPAEKPVDAPGEPRGDAPVDASDDEPTEEAMFATGERVRVLVDGKQQGGMVASWPEAKTQPKLLALDKGVWHEVAPTDIEDVCFSDESESGLMDNTPSGDIKVVAFTWLDHSPNSPAITGMLLGPEESVLGGQATAYSAHYARAVKGGGDAPIRQTRAAAGTDRKYAERSYSTGDVVAWCSDPTKATRATVVRVIFQPRVRGRPQDGVRGV